MSAEALAAALTRADVVCPTVTDALNTEVFAAAAQTGIRAKLLANFGVGFNHIDLAAASAHGLAVSNTPGVLTAATAEIAMTLLLMCARRSGEGERLVRGGSWHGWHPTHMLSTQVSGKTLGIVGMGRIGTAMARQARHGFGMRIIYSGRSPLAESVAIELGAEFLPLEDVLAQANFVSLHCPATTQTRNLINAQTLALMRPDAMLINTARGDVVNEADLLRALQSGVIAGAGLDVFAHEPIVPKALLELEQVVLLPHMGSGTVETREAMGMRAFANIRAHFAEKPLPDQVGYSKERKLWH